MAQYPDQPPATRRVAPAPYEAQAIGRDNRLAVHATLGVGLSEGHPGDSNSAHDTLRYSHGQRKNLAAMTRGLYLGTLVRAEPVVQPAGE